jgi:hypothetical protein
MMCVQSALISIRPLTLPHTPLVEKINSLVPDEIICRWINNYLADRTQVVGVNGSEPAPVLSGVPQGSVLGPLLVLIYIDDLPNIIYGLLSKINLFADDILFYHVISAPEDYTILQLAVSLIEEWSVANFLSFITGKCKYMVISRKSHPIAPSIPLKLFGSAMEKVDCCKYLELLITDNLSWSAHISSICSRAKKILGLIYR